MLVEDKDSHFELISKGTVCVCVCALFSYFNGGYVDSIKSNVDMILLDNLRQCKFICDNELFEMCSSLCWYFA